MDDKAPKPGKDRTTALERDQRVDFAANAMLRFHRRSAYIAAICREFGIQWRQAENYVREARKRLLAASQVPREEHLAEAIDFYRSMIRDEKVAHSDRIRARRNLDILLGLPAPAKHEVSAPSGLSAEDVVKVLADRDREAAGVTSRAGSEVGE